MYLILQGIYTTNPERVWKTPPGRRLVVANRNDASTKEETRWINDLSDSAESAFWQWPPVALTGRRSCLTY